jgi:hypothetical protein
VRGRGRGREGSRDCNERREQRREHGVEIWSRGTVADRSGPETLVAARRTAQEGARGREDRAVHIWAKGAERVELGADEGESKGTQKR